MGRSSQYRISLNGGIRLSFFLFLLLTLPVERGLAGEPDVLLRIPAISGEPGETVQIKFHATIRKPVSCFFIRFDLPRSAVDFLATDVSATASAPAGPRGLIFNPDHRFGQYEGFLTGARFNTQNEYTPLNPGDDLLILKATLRIRAGAQIGYHPIHIEFAGFSGPETNSLTSVVEQNGQLGVYPPTGPRPVGDLQCSQTGSHIQLGWSLPQAYDAILVQRGTIEKTLPGGDELFLDEPPPGPATYRVTAFRDGVGSRPSSCNILVQVPRPPAVSDFTCTPSETAVSLSWKNNADYNGITVFRNGRILANLPGGDHSHEDTFSSDLFTVYTIKAHLDGVATLPTTCLLNELSNVFRYWGEEVRAEPGDKSVPIRIYATYPEITQGIQMGLRGDPSLVHIRGISLAGTVIETLYEYFFYQKYRLEEGETALGISFPYETRLRRNGDQHVVTVLVDIPEDTPPGSVIPLELGSYGNPPADCLFSAGDPVRSRPAESSPGLILVGDSPLPQVSKASAWVSGDENPYTPEGGVVLQWDNPTRYSEIHLMRNGKLVAVLKGDQTRFIDIHPGPGVHRYRIVGVSGDRKSFPTVVTSSPSNAPGTFIRGDVNSDLAIDLSDPILLISYFYQGGEQPFCLDACDSDDSGWLDLTDVIANLAYQFAGGAPLPPPGPETPWFDPTPDTLTCE